MKKSAVATLVLVTCLMGHSLVRGEQRAKSWEISFSTTGMPIAFTPSQRPVSSPTVVAIRPSKIPHRYITRNLVNGQGNKATLSSSGKRLVSLLSDDFPARAQTSRN